MSESEMQEDSHSASVSVRERVLTIPELCLVAIIGPSGAGKSTFATRHFAPTEVLSSDTYRALVADDPNDQSATAAAFDALHYVAGLRLALGKLAVIDATSVKPQDRASLLRLARDHDVLAVAIVLNLDERLCQQRNAERPDRQFGPHVVSNHVRLLRRSLRSLEREGFRHVYVLNSPEQVDSVRVVREPLWTNRTWDSGPFDIVGDVHGCYDELVDLLHMLGYADDPEAGMRHPGGRRVIFVGDLVDRGPNVVETIDLARKMTVAGQALTLPGNHDDKLARYLKRRRAQVSHGLEDSLAQIEALPADERSRWVRDYQAFYDGLVSHYVLDGGRLVVAHAGLKERFQGRASRRVRDFALYGEVTGETDEQGLPVRGDWAADYRGTASVVYGHTPVGVAAWTNNTINIDTGCVFGGSLTALRWPEREMVSVPARKTYAEPLRPFMSRQGDEPDTLLRIEDVLGKQIVQTRLVGNVVIEADRTAAALEVMSRFALDPRWLIYLPPTMSPSETSHRDGYLEYPVEALAYYRRDGVTRVVCEEKHMGSRAVLVLCRDTEAAARRFGVGNEVAPGACYTRTGRQFFEDEATNQALLARLSTALSACGFWDRFDTDWVCLDAEILPWNAKAQGLLREQYAPVAAAGRASLDAAVAVAEAGRARGLPLDAVVERLRRRREDLALYAAAYGRYCWNVQGLDGVRVAPFHLLATEGQTYFDRSHSWHMTELASLAGADSLFLATSYREVDLTDADQCAGATAWWEELTGRGGEGMVVKPFDYLTRGRHGYMQPAVKCRGREYLRIIYGPDYSQPENLERLRKRGLSGKRALALRELALGVEALERFVKREPLWRVHQAVAGVLALESEPVDPRL